MTESNPFTKEQTPYPATGEPLPGSGELSPYDIAYARWNAEIVLLAKGEANKLSR